jgi:2-polyprenyl-3-methyl-5-hydroxy-6-metoxy-1,4-benzoquinol methylase
MIPNGKYYDDARNAGVTDADGCPLTEWPAKAAEKAYAIHPKGFLIFLRPAELRAMDEYAEGDTYKVQAGLDMPFQQRRFLVTIALLREALAGGARPPRILDLGCGEGHISAEILRSFPGAEVSALDCALSAISRATDLYPGIDFVVGDACEAPYAPGYFDAVVCTNLLEHLPDPLRLLGRVRRLLKVGGFLILSTPSRYRLANLLKVLRGRPVPLISKMHVTEYTVGQVLDYLRFAGLAVTQVEGKPPREAVHSVKAFVADRMIQPVVTLWLRLVKSHHSLATTVFFLARKAPQ